MEIYKAGDNPDHTLYEIKVNDVYKFRLILVGKILNWLWDKF